MQGPRDTEKLFRTKSRSLRAKRSDLEAVLSDVSRGARNVLPGPLLGYHPDVPEPWLSCTVLGDDPEAGLRAVDDAIRQAARELPALMRKERLLRYNHLPELPRSLWQIGKSPFVLVDFQAFDGRAAQVDGAGFLSAVREIFPDADLVVSSDGLPASVRDILPRFRVRVLPPMNIWPAIEEAVAIATLSGITGVLGLIAERPVHAFAPSFYAGRGLTVDHFENAAQLPLDHDGLFAELFGERSRFIDMHERIPASPLVVAEQLVAMRSQRNRLSGPVFTGGLSPWKRRALDPFLIGPSGKAKHLGSFARAGSEAVRQNGTLAVWGSKQAGKFDCPVIRFEDGFIRSRGLGVNLTYPCSLALDGEHMYYDARGESRLENILATTDFSDELLDRSRTLIRMIVEKGVSKYNVASATDMPSVASGQLKILVPGQVEKDASIRFGSPAVKSNKALVAAVRQRFPDAFIAYKAHPDVVSGLRAGGEAPQHADIVAAGGDIMQWIGWCDRVETMTSLTGFEALLRGRPVGVHGMPFFAGWGLTDDRLPVPRRSRKLSLEMLVAGTLILYPLYIHPLSAMACSPEDLVTEIARNRVVPVGPFRQFILRMTRLVNRLAVKFRDARIDM